MSLTFEKKIHRKNIIVLPQELLNEIGLMEGMKVRIYSKDDKIIIEPVKDAIWLAIHGEKIATITLEELESISLEEQAKKTDKKTEKKNKYKLLIDTTFILPTLGVEIESYAMRAYRLMSFFDIYYSEISIVEVFWASLEK